MNIQPYRSPDQFWPPKMTPWWFFAVDFLRARALRQQQIVELEVRGLELLQASLDARSGILIAPNHSFHWDSYCLLEAARKTRCPFYFMTAWQVFHQSNWFDRVSMQRCGCFSVDREGTDMQSMKTAIDILQNRKHPLVIFPEGDVYHTNDCVTPFREGAASIALMAARKAERDVVVHPVAIKRWYLQDPIEFLSETLSKLEARLYWAPKPLAPITDRILRLADGLLSLKELEHFQTTRAGPLPQRIRSLANNVLQEVESRYGIAPKETLLPERVKEVRRKIIQMQTDGAASLSQDQLQQLAVDMDTMFFVTQLYSYPGDYISNKPSRDRIAETVDKLEEDVLGAPYPSVRGPKRAVVQIGSSIALPRGKDKKLSASELTMQMQSAVQLMLDALNQEYDANHSHAFGQ